MKRNQRAQWAEETVRISQTGTYVAPSGQTINIKECIQNAVAGTVLYSPESQPARPVIPGNKANRISVANESVFTALERLTKDGGHVGCLNFASAKKPGGGFLNGAQAQEEALARASALYPCLLAQPSYYERHRTNRSTLYLDMVIFSPMVPFFRADDGKLLVEPVLASILTSPAPNAGAIARNEPQNKPLIMPTLRRRADLVLAVANAHRIEKLVLGAWGCGVFQNDPRTVAEIFRDLLRSTYHGQFDDVVFAVLDTSSDQRTYRAFESVFQE